VQKQFAFIAMLYLLAKIALFVIIWIATFKIQEKAMEAKRKREALRQQQQKMGEEEKEYIRPEDYPYR